MGKIVEREDYFAVAIEILAAADHGGLKMTPLCRRLNVTTGSFYNYFGSWAGFKTEFLAYWRDDRTIHLANAARRKVDSDQAMSALIDLACDLPHRAESAIRAWSHSDPEVRQVQTIVDEKRYEVTVELLTRAIGNREIAGKIGYLCLFVLNGYQQTQPLPSTEHLRRSLRMLEEILKPPQTAPRRDSGVADVAGVIANRSSGGRPSSG